MKHDPKIRHRRLTPFWRFVWNLRFELQWFRRDTLACPKCWKVGTWKPRRDPNRYLCKWCGYYEDLRRTGWARPCRKQRVWMLKPLKPGKTPQEMCGRVDPWRG